MKTQTPCTPQEVREKFLRQGISFANWARRHGFDTATVCQVLNGTNKASRGEGHKIAVMLGLKDGEIVQE